MDSPFREWRPDEWFDKGFLQNVKPRDVKEFLHAFCPLTDEVSAAVQSSLFAGIKQPWHYGKTQGWMRRVLHEGFSGKEFDTFDRAVAVIREKIAWPSDDVVLAVPQQPNVYATSWGIFLRYLQRGVIYLDNILVCHPTHREVVLFWEDYVNPYFGKRGHRRLPCPTWEA